MYLDGEYIHHHCKPNLEVVLAGLDLLATMSRLVYPYSGENLVRIPVRIYSPTIREKPKHVKLSRKIKTVIVSKVRLERGTKFEVFHLKRATIEVRNKPAMQWRLFR